MKKKFTEEVKNEVFNQIIYFENLLLDRKWEKDERKMRLAQDVIDMVATFEKLEVDDFNMWLFLKYRQGKLRSQNSCIKEIKPKALVDVIVEGIEIPDDASMVEIEIKPVIFKDYDRKVLSESIYKIKFGLSKGEELTVEQLKRRYGLKPSDNLYSIDDLKENGKILKFYNRKKREKQKAAARKDVGLSM